jgi:hypothetical protein
LGLWNVESPVVESSDRAAEFLAPSFRHHFVAKCGDRICMAEKGQVFRDITKVGELSPALLTHLLLAPAGDGIVHLRSLGGGEAKIARPRRLWDAQEAIIKSM